MSNPYTPEFAALFAGRRDALGIARGGVVHREVLLEDYDDHLDGLTPIGIFPMRDDSTVRFGAIDLDEPNFDLAQAMQLLIPGRSWIERSRSGNAHVWVLFKGDAPAWAVRVVLRGATEAVGRKDVEVFPKQDALRPGMVGNYINLPYFGRDRPIMVPGWHEAEPPLLELRLRQFVEAATADRQDPDSWVRRARALGGKPPAERETAAEWGEAPILHECAAYIIENAGTNRLKPGARHQVLFHLAKQLLNYREMTNDEALDLVRQVNQAGVAPIRDRELLRLFKNAVDGRYTSTGCDDPLMTDYIHPDCPIAHGD